MNAMPNNPFALTITTLTRMSTCGFLLLLFCLSAAPTTLAYDAPWNGGREDITGPDDTPDDDGCEGDNCDDCKGKKSGSPVFVANGSLIWSDDDIQFSAQTNIGLKRTYNSTDYRAGLFGRGWVSPQESGIARTYKASDGGFDSVPIWMTENGTRYSLIDDGATCIAPDVLFFFFEKQDDGAYKQIFEDSNSFNILSTNGYMLEKYSDTDGVTIYYEYDESQRLIKQYDSNGYTLNFTYNEQGFVTEVTDQANRSWSYLYDTYGRLTRVLDPDGNSKDYKYQIIDKIGYKKHLLTEVNENMASPVLRVTWQEIVLNAGKAMRVTGYTERNGLPHSYSYSDTTFDSKPAVRAVKTTRQVGGGGVLETQTYIADLSSYRILNKISQKAGQGNTTQKKVYNERGKLLEQVDERGNKTLYEYNEAGRITKTTELAGTADERIITRSYFNDTDRVAVINEYGSRETRFTYDSDLRIVDQVQVDLNSNEQRVVSYSYHPNTTDSQGNPVLGELAAIDGPQDGTQDTWAFAYDTQNRLTQVDQPLNQVVRYTYNAAGQLATDIDINGIVTQREYDSRNRLTKTTRNGRVQQFSYTVQGLIASITDELARVTAFAYNDKNQPIQVSYPSGDYLLINYDYQNDYTEVTRQYHQSDDTLISTQVSRVDPLDGVTEQEFLANNSQLVNQYQRNALNDITQIDRHGTYNNATVATENYSYDQLGQLVQTNDALNGNTEFAYDVFNRLIQVSDANQGVTQYNYSALGDLLQRSSPDTGLTQYQYDSVGNIVQEINANNVAVAYDYDALNRVTQIDYAGTELDTDLSYDSGTNGKGRLSSVTDGSGSSQYQYDDRGLITSATSNIAGTALQVAYQYNQTGQITQIDYPSGNSVAYQYDAAGRLAKIQSIQQNNTTDVLDNIFWHGANMGSFRQGNGLTTTLSYDGAGRLTDKTFGADNALQNQLDKQSQIIAQSWLRNGVNEDIAYQYDALSRLVTDGNTNNQFTYDAVGNRLSETQPNTSYAYEVNSNRLSQVNAVNIQRDAAGNTLGDGTRQYQYNAMNRLAGLSNSQNNVQAVYTYNYLGQRVRKQLSGAQTDDIRYVYGQQGELLGEYRSNGSAIREYIYQAENGIPELVAESDEFSNLIYTHTDHLGAPRLATDDNQVIVWRWDSDAFGSTTVDDDPDGDSNITVINHRFAGQFFDGESGLHYNYFRYYDSETGRYLTGDPIGIDGGLNLFLYTENNPIVELDYYGLNPLSALAAAARAAAAAGAAFCARFPRLCKSGANCLKNPKKCAKKGRKKACNALNAAMHGVCDTARSCKGNDSCLGLRIKKVQLQSCIGMRNAVSACHGKKNDPNPKGHKRAIQQVRNRIRKCDKNIKRNCCS